ncbi:MAG: UDP-N-acetylmuramate:L-alanyl-gamma-D-glutamyl-meso-diaminopimelate ligase [Gammaproteobacteria bacterium RIFCSPHIGHO2_02_FULL_42_13]|nr:MAG: UDP-N-acetylmuramate:L-alanyl-gamma-D-glutamyl-meso-diaminopimelate ligase [Gammaproteobacteria bacterium RIFCSPHIGHO2_02_FULL_42_13]OGT70476.1 MAG: UDP-N-acetylmuramate:L-alanyl-gamma-D-glutamyl-meso-diaminopimelate ligase [Gammaproteobacteria bacterium RIFCSPLOWO2_02_FULL_42_9]
MRIHILGISGTFMAGIAVLAKQLGHEVTGTDLNIYPPMSTQLEGLGISVELGYEKLPLKPDLVVVGNVIKRGNVTMEYVLNENIPYVSGPQWLYENILRHRKVLAVAGTHGKTTTSSMLAWLLDVAKLNPGFLIGGVPNNFGVSARVGSEPYFVIEADEYDCAFFDKRSKFVHYHPAIQILNNLEFDHADIFDSLEDIKKQFHHLVRIIPQNGLIVANAADENVTDVLSTGCWTPVQKFLSNEEWHAENVINAGKSFDIYRDSEKIAHIDWQVIGQHNVDDALAACVAANHIGIDAETIAQAFKTFKPVSRRFEYKGEVRGIKIYDDFAHHPTAIALTLKTMRDLAKQNRVLVILELGSYSMRSGVHRETLVNALQLADQVFIKIPKETDWDVDALAQQSNVPMQIFKDESELLNAVKALARAGDYLMVMSNTGFNRVCEKI